MMKRGIVPAAGVVAVLLVGVTLILVVTLRPWGGADEGYNTHFNFSEAAPAGYSRSLPTWIDVEPAAPHGWVLANPTSEKTGYTLYVARGCAGCHGLKATGTPVGPDLGEATASEVKRKVRKGPKGMPKYLKEDISDEDLALIVEYILDVRGSTTQEANTGAPAPPSD